MGGGKGEGMDFRGAVRGGERAGVLGEGEGGHKVENKPLM